MSVEEPLNSTLPSQPTSPTGRLTPDAGDGLPGPVGVTAATPAALAVHDTDPAIPTAPGSVPESSTPESLADSPAAAAAVRAAEECLSNQGGIDHPSMRLAIEVTRGLMDAGDVRRENAKNAKEQIEKILRDCASDWEAKAHQLEGLYRTYWNVDWICQSRLAMSIRDQSLSLGPLNEIYDDLSTQVRGVSRHLKGPVESEDVESAKCEVFKAVTPDFARYVTHGVMYMAVFEAAIWQFVISEIFEGECGLWAGVDGKDFDRICNHLADIPSTKRGPNMHPTDWVRFQDARARFAQVLPGAATRSFAAQGACFAPEVIPESIRVVSAFLDKFAPFLQGQGLGPREEEALLSTLRSAAYLKLLLRCEREEYKVTMTNGLDGSENKFHFDPLTMKRNAIIDFLDEDAFRGGHSPRVAFTVRPMVTRRGACYLETAPLEWTDKPTLAVQSSVMLEGCIERFWEYFLRVQAEAATTGPEGDGGGDEEP